MVCHARRIKSRTREIGRGREGVVATVSFLDDNHIGLIFLFSKTGRVPQLVAIGDDMKSQPHMRVTNLVVHERRCWLASCFPYQMTEQWNMHLTLVYIISACWSEWGKQEKTNPWNFGQRKLDFGLELENLFLTAGHRSKRLNDVYRGENNRPENSFETVSRERHAGVGCIYFRWALKLVLSFFYFFCDFLLHWSVIYDTKKWDPSPPPQVRRKRWRYC